MRPRTVSPPVAAAPVDGVVPALAAGSGPVRYLVPAVAGGGEGLVGRLVFVRQLVGVGQADPAPRGLRPHPGAGFDRQRVGAHVVRLKREGRIDRSPPLPHRLPRRAVDEVDGDVEPGLPGPRDRPFHLARRVPSVEGCQHGSDGGLHAEGDPRESGVGEPQEAVAADGFGVGLGGHLRSGAQPEGRVEGCQDPSQLAGVEHRGRAAAEERRVEEPAFAAQDAAAEGYLPRQRSGEVVDGRSRPHAEVRVRVEVAVPASDGAEGYVDVGGEAAVDAGVGQGAVRRGLLAVGELRHAGTPGRGSCGRRRPLAVRTAS